VGLGAVLRPDAEQDETPGVGFDGDDRAVAGEFVFPAKPAGGVDGGVGEAGDDAGLLGGEALGELEEGGLAVEAPGGGGEPSAERVAGVDFEIDEGAGAVDLVAVELLFEVFDAQGEAFEEEAGGLADGDEGAAGL